MWDMTEIWNTPCQKITTDYDYDERNEDQRFVVIHRIAKHAQKRNEHDCLTRQNSIPIQLLPYRVQCLPSVRGDT
ncbi:uncharacterized protein EAF01_006292 [Botrytis porri]|uniref:uncharacterized protein n=1 Tax=Botrytis porri TaxID=87229 RepID=UPI0019026799|nr:uncharacterized protein EAF01_006292 [Botrytis porri]KAF7903243.1 hypothetical protein EAF01_006292 [Botrytis porri]